MQDTQYAQPRKSVKWLKRIVTSLIFAAAAFIYLNHFKLVGGVYFLAFLCGLTSVEFLTLRHRKLPLVFKVFFAVLAFLTPILLYEMGKQYPIRGMGLIAFEGLLLVVWILHLFGIWKYAILKQLTASPFYSIWGISLPFSALVILTFFLNDQGVSFDAALVGSLIIIAFTKMNDIGALLIGSMTGKTALAPRISPAKTVEGVLGGFFFCLFWLILTHFLFLIDLYEDYLQFSTFHWLMLQVGYALLTNVAGTLGDLYESALKRLVGKKNSGGWLPGLGGIWDLTDSLIFTTPVAYLYIKYIVF